MIHNIPFEVLKVLSTGGQAEQRCLSIPATRWVEGKLKGLFKRWAGRYRVKSFNQIRLAPSRRDVRYTKTHRGGAESNRGVIGDRNALGMLYSGRH